MPRFTDASFVPDELLKEFHAVVKVIALLTGAGVSKMDKSAQYYA